MNPNVEAQAEAEAEPPVVAMAGAKWSLQPKLQAARARLQPAVEAVKLRLQPTVQSVSSFTRLLNELVRPEAEEDKSSPPGDARQDWFEAYDCCRTTSCCASYKCCPGYVHKTAISVSVLILVGVLVSVVSLIELTGDAPSLLRSNATGGSGGSGGTGSGTGSGGGTESPGGTGMDSGYSYSNLGVCYGRVADDLPSPAQVVALIRSQGLGLVRMFDAEPTVLQALANSGIKVIAGVPNDQIPKLAKSSRVARNWLEDNIVKFSSTDIIALSVGNEVLTANPEMSSYLVAATRNVHNGLVALNLDSKIKLSSTMAVSVLSNSYPPSAGTFRPDLVGLMSDFLDFLAETKSVFMLNVYPYFAYKDNMDVISFEYATFGPNAGVQDSQTGLQYSNLFDAQLDAVISAMGALGHKSDIPLVVTETGWPSKGDSNEAAASFSNAATYNNNLISHIISGNGTPLRPGSAITAYIFALFNEDQKPGPTTERNFGLFEPDMQRVYTLDLLPAGGGGSGNGGGNGESDGEGSGEEGSSGDISPPERNWIHSVQTIKGRW